MSGLFYQWSSENWKGHPSGRHRSVQMAVFIKRRGMKIGYLCKKGALYLPVEKQDAATEKNRFCLLLEKDALDCVICADGCFKLSCLPLKNRAIQIRSYQR